jgi:hypothetical protein
MFDRFLDERITDDSTSQPAAAGLLASSLHVSLVRTADARRLRSHSRPYNARDPGA